MRNASRHGDGWTVLETVIVLAIITILAWLAYGRFIGIQQSAQDGVARDNLQRVASKEYLHQSAWGYFTPHQSDLGLLQEGITLVAAPGASSSAHVVSLAVGNADGDLGMVAWSATTETCIGMLIDEGGNTTIDDNIAGVSTPAACDGRAMLDSGDVLNQPLVRP